MYPTDRRQLNTERQIYLDKQSFVDVFSIPACVRNTNGDFIGYNEKFSKEFIGSLDIKEWFYSLPVQVATSFLREELDAMSLPSSMNKIQSVAIGDKLWLVQFIPLIYGEVVNVLWLFFCKNSKEGANKQVISSQADSLIKISRIWADFFPANTSNQPI
ncbi:hypothetical protein MZT69_25485 [Escherichia coli]